MNTQSVQVLQGMLFASLMIIHASLMSLDLSRQIKLMGFNVTGLRPAKTKKTTLPQRLEGNTQSTASQVEGVDTLIPTSFARLVRPSYTPQKEYVHTVENWATRFPSLHELLKEKAQFLGYNGEIPDINKFNVLFLYHENKHLSNGLNGFHAAYLGHKRKGSIGTDLTRSFIVAHGSSFILDRPSTLLVPCNNLGISFIAAASKVLK